jgi:hypothetical protein
LKEAADWVGEYRRFWDESFERLDDVLQDLVKEMESGENDRREDGGEG